MTRIVLLGPQRRVPTVRQVLDDLEIDGPLAVVTAGWEEREDEVEELAEHVGCELRNLALFHRMDTVLAEDPELLEAKHALNDRLRALQSIYRVRLGHAMQAIRDLRAKASLGPFDDEFQREIEHSLGAVHVLDQHHMERTRDVQDSFMETWTPASRESVARAREEIEAELDGCAAVAIAGGHVAVLLSRLQMFLMDELLGSRALPVVAWSAGAMAITRQVVLFHDSPPQGRGDAEVLFAGLGLCSDLVALPHASRRLLLDDEHRVSVLAKRFAPASCVALDEGSRADWDGNRWTLGSGTRWLMASGEVVKEQTFA